MAYRRRTLPEDIKQLVDLIQRGKLFAVQGWIKDGKRLRDPEVVNGASIALEAAVTSGFHSMVEELLRAEGWSTSVLAECLDQARSRKRYDIADLLLNHGAQGKQRDFQTCCTELDLSMMKRHLRAGTDPNRDNDFAQALSSMKARPLLRFYREFRSEFPALDDQAALALSEAVQRDQVRWTALLAWAGADPFRSVPCDLSGTFPVDPDNCTTAAKEAAWRNRPEILKVLHLNPTPEQAVELLNTTAYRGNPVLFRSLLSKVNAKVINDSPRGGSSALEELLRRHHDNLLWNRDEPTKEDADTLRSLEMLLDAGARWRPDPSDFRYARRALLKHDARYIVQVVRLLLYTPDAVEVPQFLEFCRSQSLTSQIGVADPQLHEEMKALRKSGRALSAGDAVTSTGIAPLAAELARIPFSLAEPPPAQPFPPAA
jgi:hypothetical protein